MRKSIFLVVSILFLQTNAFSIKPKYGPAGAPIAIPISADHSFFQSRRNPAPDFWALSSFYVPQFNGYSCSMASTVMVLNGLFNANSNRGDEDENITQQGLLKEMQGTNWDELVSEKGLEGRHGVTLSQFADFIERAIPHYHKGEYEVRKFEIRDTNKDKLELLRGYLEKNEKSSDDFIIIHFVQDDLTLAEGGPYAHTSPIGAYDRKHKRVLIFDVDRDWYEPYWVSDEDLLKALAHKTETFGYGGFIYIRKIK
jgi:Phytochelatin synthase